MAEAVFRHLVKEAGLANNFDIASAGTGSWHVGERPHSGTISVLRQNGIDPGNKRANQLNRSDMREYGYIIAMDDENVGSVQALFGKRIPRLLDFVPDTKARNVPDPYYVGGFDSVYSLVHTGCQSLLAHIRAQEKI